MADNSREITIDPRKNPATEHARGNSAFLVAAGATALEYYDFMLFGIAASIMFGPVFFPVANPLTATLLALASFGVGFVARPLGGILSGHFGDRYGRRPVLLASLVAMGTATTLVGLLPGYRQIGWWAPVLLVVLRLVQGLATGGESGGAIVYGVENAPAGKRGVFGSYSGMGQSLGALLAIGAFTAVSAAMPESALLSWGWRVPFLAGGIVTLIGILALARTRDTKDFVSEVGAGKAGRTPLRVLFREHPRALLLATGLSVGTNGLIYILLTFAITYSKDNGWSGSQALAGQVLLVAAVAAAVIFAGALADRIGAHKAVVLGAVLTAVFNFVLFGVIAGHSQVAFFAAFAVAGVINALITGPTPVYFASLFPTKVRYSGVSLAYQTGAAISGFAPAAAVFFFDVSGQAVWSVPLFGVVLAGILAVCTLLLRNSAREFETEGERR
ncbi:MULTISPECIES: MFS transporter [Amycolatopsis]|uniref:MFS transporter n=3 Tax=Amycolatopsis TaxID=1813 RepID=A0ABW5I154_9PSEU